MVAMEGLWGCLPGAFRALYAEWGDSPSLGDNLSNVGHRAGRQPGWFLLQHWHGLTQPLKQIQTLGLSAVLKEVSPF